MSRFHMLQILLGAQDATSWAVQLSVQELRTEDYPAVENIAFHGKLSAEVADRLLTEAGRPARGMVALAMFAGRGWRAAWTPGESESSWVEAVVELRPVDLPGQHYDTTELFRYLGSAYPQTLADLVERALTDANDGQRYEALPHAAWDLLYHLPARHKRRLWRRFKNQPLTRYLLQQHLVGTDLEWLEQMLDSGEMAPEDALLCFTGFGPQPSITKLAKLLVPRGIAPEEIAGLRLGGVWSGPQSAHLQSIADSFEAMATDEDPSVRAVAAAGSTMFIAARDDAAARERRQRVRGER